DRRDHIAHGAHAAELVGLDALAGHFLELDGEVDGVDRVELEVLVEVGLGRDARRVDLKGVGEELAQPGEDLGLGHAVACAQQIGRGIAIRSTKNRSSATVRLRAPARFFATRAAGVTQACTSTSMRTTRAGHAYHFAPLVSTRGSQRSTTGRMGTPVVSAICAAPRTKCSGSPGTVRVPSGKMTSGSPCASFAA